MIVCSKCNKKKHQSKFPIKKVWRKRLFLYRYYPTKVCYSCKSNMVKNRYNLMSKTQKLSSIKNSYLRKKKLRSIEELNIITRRNAFVKLYNDGYITFDGKLSTGILK